MILEMCSKTESRESNGENQTSKEDKTSKLSSSHLSIDPYPPRLKTQRSIDPSVKERENLQAETAIPPFRMGSNQSTLEEGYSGEGEEVGRPAGGVDFPAKGRTGVVQWKLRMVCTKTFSSVKGGSGVGWCGRQARQGDDGR
jgi:hypothetical protein